MYYMEVIPILEAYLGTVEVGSEIVQLLSPAAWMSHLLHTSGSFLDFVYGQRSRNGGQMSHICNDKRTFLHRICTQPHCNAVEYL